MIVVRHGNESIYRLSMAERSVLIINKRCNRSNCYGTRTVDDAVVWNYIITCFTQLCGAMNMCKWKPATSPCWSFCLEFLRIPTCSLFVLSLRRRLYFTRRMPRAASVILPLISFSFWFCLRPRRKIENKNTSDWWSHDDYWYNTKLLVSFSYTNAHKRTDQSWHISIDQKPIQRNWCFIDEMFYCWK